MARSAWFEKTFDTISDLCIATELTIRSRKHELDYPKQKSYSPQNSQMMKWGSTLYLVEVSKK